MGEDITPSANAPAANADPPALAATPSSNAQAATDNNNSEPITLEEARRLRSEGQALRKRLKAYEEAEEAAKTAALSEVEKANKRATEAEQKIQQYQKQLVTAQVKLAAQAKGIIDPDIAALAIADKLEYGDDGMPTNTDKALDDLIKNKPYLAAKPAEVPPGSPAQTAQPAGTPTTPTIPAMNPGRVSIPSPAGQQLPPGQRYKLSDLLKTD
jgi:hypothetical protein